MKTPLVILSTAALVGIAAPAAARQCRATLIVVNARVHTVDPALPAAQAIAVCGDTIARVGTDAEVRQLAGAGTRVIDAGGRLVVPGFNDAHVHLVSGADELVGVDLRPATSEAEMAGRLRAYVATQPKGRWVIGGYWDHEAWASKALPTRAHIDAATLGVSREAFAAELLQSWSVPDEVCDAVRFQHVTDYSGPHAAYVGLLRLTTVLLNARGLTSMPHASGATETLSKRFELDADAVNDVMTQIASSADELHGFAQAIAC